MGTVSNDDIRWLISLVLSEQLAELEVNDGDCGVTVGRVVASPNTAAQPSSSAGAVIGADAADLVPVKAPMAGVFYRSAAPDSPPFVEAGDEVQAGETVGLIEAMKLYNDIEAPCAGRVTSVVATDADRVAADEDLMYIKPSSD